jgi:hypothetical protein
MENGNRNSLPGSPALKGSKFHEREYVAILQEGLDEGSE